MTRVYLDHAATSPLRPEVFEAMRPWLTTGFGNASTLYQEGKRARQALDEARATIAHLIGASPIELVFTSGGTESNNTLIAGIVHAVRAQKGREKGGNHLVGSAFEHHAVLEPLQALRREGYELTLVKPTRDGFIDPEDFAQTLRPNTMLTSIMTAQNEIGTIQPIAALVQHAHRNQTLFHTDAVQALGKIAFDVKALGIDAASFSAHKLGGPQGIGAFFLKRQTPFVALQPGGGQEGKRRGGTQNIAGAVGFAKALELAEKEREQEAARLTALRDHLATTLPTLSSRVTLTVPLDKQPEPPPLALSETPSVAVTGAPTFASTLSGPSVATAAAVPTPTHLPNVVSFLVAGLESETLILKLDSAGFAVSGGSACSTGSLEPSHVLSSLGLSRDAAHGVLRVSLGHENTRAHLDTFISTLAPLLPT
jgi:cysteine desulfurase